jgi:hypothetical protein
MHLVLPFDVKSQNSGIEALFPQILVEEAGDFLKGLLGLVPQRLACCCASL